MWVFVIVSDVSDDVNLSSRNVSNSSYNSLSSSAAATLVVVVVRRWQSMYSEVAVLLLRLHAVGHWASVARALATNMSTLVQMSSTAISIAMIANWNLSNQIKNFCHPPYKNLDDLIYLTVALQVNSLWNLLTFRRRWITYSRVACQTCEPSRVRINVLAKFYESHSFIGFPLQAMLSFCAISVKFIGIKFPTRSIKTYNYNTYNY